MCWFSRLAGLIVAAGIAAPTWAADPPTGTLAPPAHTRAGNRLTYLDENNPWYPHRGFPKLITPQWVGDEGVECVVVLAIDDMREPAKYEAYLRPILNRLKQIDGRAPVSIMTCNVKPDDPLLAQWLAEGLSLEVHTVDHPCPLLQGGDLAKAKATYDRCVDLLNEIPGNKPVAFRMPCCDSLNTVSPRFFSEIFNQTTPKGNFLSLDSSVFNLYTPNDPDLPRDLVLDSDGRDKFRKYLPKGLVREGKTFDTFVNYIEDYPYPYIINRLCWEFPCVVPSDWSAQHLQKSNSPDTVRDLKAALDITVLKQGVFNLVFHPHGWIKAEQIVELIDHAVAKHGPKVKFLTFREALERLEANVFWSVPVRNKWRPGQFGSRGALGGANGCFLLDLNGDGFQDVLQGNSIIANSGKSSNVRLWSPKSQSWSEINFWSGLAYPKSEFRYDASRFEYAAHFGVVQRDNIASVMLQSGVLNEAFHFRDSMRVADESLKQLRQIVGASFPIDQAAMDRGVVLRDVDGDGLCELIISNGPNQAIYGIVNFSDPPRWAKLPFAMPGGVTIATPTRRDAGLRFVDLDEDGSDDLVFSNVERFGVYLFNDMQTGWSRVVLEGKHVPQEASGGREPPGSSNIRTVPPEQNGATPPATPVRRGGEVVGPAPQAVNGERFDLPPIVRADGTENGFFVHSRHLFWQNEDTAKLPDLVDRRSFNEILSQARDLPPKPKAAQAALESIRVRPGFRVELMAAEPLVLDPVSFAFGADGKLWVVEMGDYPLGMKEVSDVGLPELEGVPQKPQGPTPPSPPLRRGGERAVAALADGTAKDHDSPLLKGGGQIRCLEDTDGDGRYDKATIFLEVPYPTGVFPWRKGILVSAAPNILYVEDTEGDGIADKREVLYTGFVEGNQQHRVNGFAWGLDNWIYLANGDSGGVIESKKTGKKVTISGRDLRIHPDTGDLDAVTGQTQFGRSRDDWGNWFGCNNSNPMYQFVLDDAYQRRNPHYPAPAPRVDVPEVAGNAPVFPISQLQARFNDFHTANRFTSACSAMIYRDDLFGPNFAGNAFICEPVHNLVHRELVTPKGLTFTSRRAPDEQESEFLASSDNWFRPTTVKTGPDGALWIADMYRHVIEHPQWIPDTWQKRLDLRAGHDKGRLYRVFPVDKTPRPIPRLDRLDTAGLVAALDSPSGWQRDMAQQLLVDRQDKTAIPLLEAQVVSGKRPEARLHALCALEAVAPLPERPRILLRALADPHPGVRRHAVRLTGMIPRLGEDFEAGLAALLKCETDPDPHVRLQLAYALGDLTGAVAQESAGSAIGRMLVADGHDRFLLAALMSSVNKANVEYVLSSVVKSAGDSAPNQNLIGTLLDVAAALGNDQALAKLVQYVTRQADGRYAEWQFTAFGHLLDSLARRNESLVRKINQSKVPETESLRASVDRLFAAARRLAADREATVEARVPALRLMGRGGNEGESDLDLLSGFLSPQTPPELQAAAVESLGRLRNDRIPGQLLAAWRGYGPVRRLQVLDLLVSRDAWAAELMAAVADSRVAVTDFDASRRQRLLEHRSADVRERAGKAFGGTVLDNDRQKVIDQYQSALTLRGDLSRGAQLFSRICATCHKLAGTGHDVGPDLASLTDKSPEALLIAILDPNRAVESKFVTYVAETKSGMTFSGLLASETGNSITLLGPERKEQVILRADLEELVSTSKSSMPEGLEKDVKVQDLADIIAHVRANVPLPQRKAFPGNEPQAVLPDADGTLVLAATVCEIYGSTLIFESQYKNLGYWCSLDDHAVWNIEVAKPGKYRVEFDWACDASVAGNPWRLETAGGTLAGEVPSRGNWETYRQKQVGEVTLPGGKQRVVLRPVRKPQGAMIDLRAVRLVRIKPP